MFIRRCFISWKVFRKLKLFIWVQSVSAWLIFNLLQTIRQHEAVNHNANLVLRDCFTACWRHWSGISLPKISDIFAFIRGRTWCSIYWPINCRGGHPLSMSVQFLILVLQVHLLIILFIFTLSFLSRMCESSTWRGGSGRSNFHSFFAFFGGFLRIEISVFIWQTFIKRKENLPISF